MQVRDTVRELAEDQRLPPRLAAATRRGPPWACGRSTTSGAPSSTPYPRTRRAATPPPPTRSARRPGRRRADALPGAALGRGDGPRLPLRHVPGAHARVVVGDGRRRHVDLRRVPAQPVRRVGDRGRGAHVRPGPARDAQPLQRRARRRPDPVRRRGRAGTDPEPRGRPRRRARRGREDGGVARHLPPRGLEGVHDPARRPGRDHPGLDARRRGARAAVPRARPCARREARLRAQGDQPHRRQRRRPATSGPRPRPTPTSTS